MTTSSETTFVGAIDSGPPAELRSWIAAVADELIPAAATMPSAAELGAGGTQLDIVLSARPDLAPTLRRAWELAGEVSPPDVLDALRSADGACFDAIRLVVAGGYYVHPTVRELLGYHGQEPRVVRVDVIPEYMEEGLLERVMERGQIFRDDH